MDETRAQCTEILKTWLDDLQSVWNDVGIPDDQLTTRMKVVTDSLCELRDMMVTEERQRRDGYVKNIEKCRDECERLAEELETDYKEPDERLTILKKEKFLRDQVKQLLKERQIRLREVISLRTAEGELCARLGRIPEYIQSDTILTKDQLKEAKTRISMLTAEKNKREIKLAIAAKDILELWTSLNIKARTEREEFIESGNLDSFQLSNENMAWLEQIKQSLTIQLDENKNLQKTLLMKLESLWSRMELPTEDRATFLDQHRGYSDIVVVKIKEEVQKMEELKLQNLEKFIKLTREEIEQYWEKMFVAEEDKKLFSAFYSDNIGENLLAEHEIKLDTLSNDFMRDEALYREISNRNKLWTAWEEFECKENDPNRFDNRGGKLLLEEKQRKKILRELPKVEESIQKQIAIWETENERLFTVYGHKFTDLINNQKEELALRKDQIKENKVRAKEEAMQKDLAFGSTPAKTPKRRIAGTTILTPANKRTKIATPTTTRTPTRTPGARSKFVHSSLMSRSPMKGTPNKDKNFPRVMVKLPLTPGGKRPDTPIKQRPPPTEDILPPPPPVENSVDSGCVSIADMELPAAPAPEYEDFEKEVNRPSRELMRSSSIHETPEPQTVRKSLLFTIQESDD